MQSRRVCKRVVDAIIASFGLLLSAPIMGFIALALRMEAKGELIFRQERLGKGGTTFSLLKFRKFPPNWGRNGPGVTVAGDARMTQLGAFLARTKLDELPQLWNILRNEMSLVGPRPESMDHADLFTGEYAELLRYTPGLFGPNQIAFRNEASMYPADEEPDAFYRRVLFPKKAQVDLAYFRESGCISELVWVLRGIGAAIYGVIDWKRFVGLHSKIVAMDIVAVIAAWFVVNLIRFAGIPEDANLRALLIGLWVLPLFVVGTMALGASYRTPVRNFSFVDALHLAKVSAIGWVLGYLVVMVLHRNVSIFLGMTGFIVVFPFLSLPRVVGRLYWENKLEKPETTVHNVLIYGAGIGGTSLLRWLSKGSSSFDVCGFIDDAPPLRSRQLNGYKILGRQSDIPTINKVYHVDELWVTFRPTWQQKQRVQKICAQEAIKLIVLSDTEPFSRIITNTRPTKDARGQPDDSPHMSAELRPQHDTRAAG